MIKEISYISIFEVLSRVLRHPLLQDVSLEQAVQYTIDFIGIFGLGKMYEDRETELHIEDYRAKLPCDLISIIGVQDNKSGNNLRTMTGQFNHTKKGGVYEHRHFYRPLELSYKTQGQVIFTSFKEGDITVAYKAIPVDNDGFPLLIDNSVYLSCLEAYIKKQAFTILFDCDKISDKVLNQALQDYAWRAGQLQHEFIIPSVQEMESLKNSWCTLIQRTDEFRDGFRGLGNKELLKIH